MITQLNPPLPMHTPKGSGWAHFVLDHGVEADLMWVVFLDEDGSCWSVPNSDIRMAWNWSLGRRKQDDRGAVAPTVPEVPKSNPRMHVFSGRTDT